jgi:hypothetical protein
MPQMMAFLRNMLLVCFLVTISLLADPASSFSQSIGSTRRWTKENAIRPLGRLQLEAPLAMGVEESSPGSRRVFVQAGVIQTAAVAALLFGGGVAPAAADVSDGNALPEGAAQFGRVVRTKVDLAVSMGSLTRGSDCAFSARRSPPVASNARHQRQDWGMLAGVVNSAAGRAN